MNQKLEFDRDELARICQEFGIARLELFGSAARSDFRADSDVDVLVQFLDGETPPLSGLIRLRNRLSMLFGGRDVDVATNAILRNPYRKQAIQKDLEILYAA